MPYLIKGERSQILNGLIRGRVRKASAKDGSTIALPFEEALSEATREELLWALNLLVKTRDQMQTYRTKRIKAIDARLRSEANE